MYGCRWTWSLQLCQTYHIALLDVSTLFQEQLCTRQMACSATYCMLSADLSMYAGDWAGRLSVACTHPENSIVEPCSYI